MKSEFCVFHSIRCVDAHGTVGYLCHALCGGVVIPIPKTRKVRPLESVMSRINQLAGIRCRRSHVVLAAAFLLFPT